MTDEKKRLTGAELRQQQEDRERQRAEGAARASIRSAEDAEKTRQEADRKAADQIKATWYDTVTQASEHGGVRFVVLAKVAGDGAAAVVEGIIQAVQDGGFAARLAGPHKDPNPSVRPKAIMTAAEAGEVFDSGLKGWRPAAVPCLGGGDGDQWLIVTW